MTDDAGDRPTLSRGTLLWTVGLGVASVVVFVVLAVVNDLRWGVPAVALLVYVGVRPVARAYGARKARALGQDARARRESRRDVM